MAAVAYGDVARRIALRLKYGGRPGLAETIARHMRRLAADVEDALVVPVPLHRWRLWRRGYNQAGLIARAFARQRGLPLDVDLVTRRRATPMLRGMGPKARAKAVRGAFALRSGARDAVPGGGSCWSTTSTPPAPPPAPAPACSSAPGLPKYGCCAGRGWCAARR